MRPRPNPKFRPDLERLEGKQLLSTGAHQHPHRRAGAPVTQADTPASSGHLPVGGYTVARITNPTPFNARLRPPFGHVLVQHQQPIPGQVYNILYLTMRNSSQKTFTAADNLRVKLSGQVDTVPALTGDETWPPGKVFIFYVVSKQYYPVNNVVSGGFEFSFNGERQVAIPGPSAIYLRITYKPNRINHVLDKIANDGPNPYSGSRGFHLGIADTALWEFKPTVEIHKPRRLG